MNGHCKNCQFFRQGKWCSNSKSNYYQANVTPNDGCVAFIDRNAKAPEWLRLANWISKVTKR